MLKVLGGFLRVLWRRASTPMMSATLSYAELERSLLQIAARLPLRGLLLKMKTSLSAGLHVIDTTSTIGRAPCDDNPEGFGGSPHIHSAVLLSLNSIPQSPNAAIYASGGAILITYAHYAFSRSVAKRTSVLQSRLCRLAHRSMERGGEAR